MKKLITVLLIIVTIILLIKFFVLKSNSSDGLSKIKINDHEILVEIADTPDKRAQGLSGRKNLPPNQGMLFVFEAPGRHRFWMKEMLFPLDFIWLKENRVVEVTANVKLEDYQPPKTLVPQFPVDHVLEVSSGTIEKLKIKIGDSVQF